MDFEEIPEHDKITLQQVVEKQSKMIFKVYTAARGSLDDLISFYLSYMISNMYIPSVEPREPVKEVTIEIKLPSEIHTWRAIPDISGEIIHTVRDRTDEELDI